VADRDLDSISTSFEWCRHTSAPLAWAGSYLAPLVLLAGPLAATRALAGQRSATSDAIPAVGEGWPTYGGNAGGLRFSKSSQITRFNVGKLHSVWPFHTHAVDSNADRTEMPSFETTPVISDDMLYLTSPFDVVFALDARTGAERWHYDPKLRPLTPQSVVTSRGVALWPLGSVAEANATTRSHCVFTWSTRSRHIEFTYSSDLWSRPAR
jgi:glucose dehydrogenase